jgi:hypothetical protein
MGRTNGRAPAPVALLLNNASRVDAELAPNEWQLLRIGPQNRTVAIVQLSRLKHFQPSCKIIRMIAVQVEKAVGFLNDPGVDHSLAVDPRVGVEPFGHFEPVPERAVGRDSCHRIGEA